jgi:hypothetical protein
VEDRAYRCDHSHEYACIASAGLIAQTYRSLPSFVEHILVVSLCPLGHDARPPLLLPRPVCPFHHRFCYLPIPRPSKYLHLPPSLPNVADYFTGRVETIDPQFANASTACNSSTSSTSSTSTTSTSTSIDDGLGAICISSECFISQNTTDSSNFAVTTITSSSVLTATSSCEGSVTYFDTIPPTTYITITEGFNVTVTAQNVSLTTPPLITPLSPCFQTLVPNLVTFATATSTCTGNCPEVISESAPPQPSSSAFTSTVIVTKKTPVPTVVPQTPTSSAPNFEAPPTTQGGNPAVTTGGGSGGGGGTTSQPGVTNVGQIINSVINGPATTQPAPSPTPTPISGPTTKEAVAINTAAAFVPTTTTINNVPVVVLPSSSVVIGGQLVSVPPAGSSTSVVVNGQTYVVSGTNVIAPSTTFAIPVQAADAKTTAAPVLTTLTANGLTFSYDQSEIYVSGTSYRIGSGAGSTVVTVGGKTLTLDSSGIVLPSTTIAPLTGVSATGTGTPGLQGGAAGLCPGVGLERSVFLMFVMIFGWTLV